MVHEIWGVTYMESVVCQYKSCEIEIIEQSNGHYKVKEFEFLILMIDQPFLIILQYLSFTIWTKWFLYIISLTAILIFCKASEKFPHFLFLLFVRIFLKLILFFFLFYCLYLSI